MAIRLGAPAAYKLTAADKQWVDYLVASYDEEAIEDYLLHLLGLKSCPHILAHIYRAALVKIDDLKVKGLYEAERKKLSAAAKRYQEKARRAIQPTIPPFNPTRSDFFERTRQFMEKSEAERDGVAALFEFVEQHTLWGVIALLMTRPAKKKAGRPTGAHDLRGDVARIKKMKFLISGNESPRQAALAVVKAMPRRGGNVESQARRLMLAYRRRMALRVVEK